MLKTARQRILHTDNKVLFLFSEKNVLFYCPDADEMLNEAETHWLRRATVALLLFTKQRSVPLKSRHGGVVGSTDAGCDEGEKQKKRSNAAPRCLK